MTLDEERQLDRVFMALADPTRRAIIAQLSKDPSNVSDLPNPQGLSPAAITKHLKVLESAGLVRRGRVAQFRPCELNPEALNAAMAWISDRRAFWESNFDRLAMVLRPDPT